MLLPVFPFLFHAIFATVATPWEATNKALHHAECLDVSLLYPLRMKDQRSYHDYKVPWSTFRTVLSTLLLLSEK